MKLTDEQQLILDNCESNFYISAAPGSGKSTMLSQITTKLLKNPDNHVMLVTFTNKAAKSIIAKCENADQDRITGGTFHGLSNKFMKANRYHWNICDEGKKRLIIKKVFDCKKDRQKLMSILDEIGQAKSQFPMGTSPNLILYEEELTKYFLVDFDDMIHTFIHTCPAIRFHLPNITHILVDELQDTSAPQLEMLKVLQTKTKANVIGVADDDQCQPGYTQVLTTNGYKAMKDLDSEKDRVVSFISKGSYIGGLKNGYKFDIACRDYTGLFFGLIVGDKKADCTSNHKWLVRWSDKAKDKDINVVYLMKKDNKYRIGWCQLFNSEGSFHLGTRSRLEKADGTWIIEVCNSKREASIAESSIAFSYGIPTITFEQSTGGYYDKEAVELIYKSIGHKKIQDRAEHLLVDAKLSKDYPIWSKELASSKRGGAQRFKIQACNLIKNMFEIPVQTKGKKFEWKELTDLTSFNRTTPIKVYSLDVKVGEDNGPNSKTYICNKGMVTGNSIYAWRGARPENVQDFISHFKCPIYNMGYNFRSCTRIVDTSRDLIEHNKQRISKTIRAFSTEKGYVQEKSCANQFDQIDYLVAKCRQFRDQEATILYRNRTYKNHLEFALRKANLKYCVNDALDIVDRSAIKVMLSTMKIAALMGDVYDLEIASKAIKGLGMGTVNSIAKMVTKTKSVSDVLKEKFQDPKGVRRLMSLLDLVRWYDDNHNSKLEVFARKIEEYFTTSFDYQEDMRAFILDITNDYKTDSADIIDLCNDLGLDGKEEHNDEGAKIELSTVHGYKGLERDIVMMPWCDSYLEPKPGKEIILEDERRLFYVGATRAKNKLIMTYTGRMPQFIKEMNIYAY